MPDEKEQPTTESAPKPTGSPSGQAPPPAQSPLDPTEAKTEETPSNADSAPGDDKAAEDQDAADQAAERADKADVIAAGQAGAPPTDPSAFQTVDQARSARTAALKLMTTTVAASAKQGIQEVLDTTRKNANAMAAQVEAFVIGIEPLIERELALAMTGDATAAATLEIIAGQVAGKAAEAALSMEVAEQEMIVHVVATAIRTAVSLLLAMA